jgi:CheY-like chemotaxis protein
VSTIATVRRVLVVDDESLTREVVGALIEGGDVAVAMAASGQQAVDMVRESAPDLVLLDVMMPGMDGFEVCRLIKSDPETKAVRIVMLTALSDAHARRCADDAGADGYLVKPFSARELFAVLDDVGGQ